MNQYMISIIGEKVDYELFRSEISHAFHNLGPEKFRNNIISNKYIESLWKTEQFTEALYLLSAVDYLSDQLNIPFYTGYNDYRLMKLTNMRFPREVLLMDAITKSDHMKKQAIEDCKNHPCGKYFFQHNIIERSIDDAV